MLSHKPDSNCVAVEILFVNNVVNQLISFFVNHVYEAHCVKKIPHAILWAPIISGFVEAIIKDPPRYFTAAKL